MAMDLIGLQDAIVAGLNAETFSEALAAERNYDIAKEPSEISAAVAIVILKEVVEVEKITRGKSTMSATVGVVIEKAVNTRDQATLDALLNLSQDVLDYMRYKQYKTLDGEPFAINSQLTTPYDTASLNAGIFISAIDIEFKFIGV